MTASQVCTKVTAFDVPEFGVACVTKKPFYNSPPAKDNAPQGAPLDIQRAEFARRLQRMLAEKGWNQSELARRIARSEGSEAIDRSSVSLYIRGKTLPRPETLYHIAKVFDVEASDLLPATITASVDHSAPTIEVKDADPGFAWVRLNIRLPWDKALEIARIARTGD